MKDTPKEIFKKQFEILYSKPLEEKIKGLFELTELSRMIIQNRIKSENPEISGSDLRVETFKAFYRLDFDQSSLNLIAGSMKHYLENQSRAPGV